MTTETKEIQHSEETKGKLSAFQQILDVISAKQTAIPEKIQIAKGEVKACTTLYEVIQGRITDRIHKLAAKGIEREQIKDEQEFALTLRNLCAATRQEAVNEKIRLEGEARALLLEVESISNLAKKAIADEQTLLNFEKQQEKFHEQKELMNQEPEEDDENETEDEETEEEQQSMESTSAQKRKAILARMS